MALSWMIFHHSHYSTMIHRLLSLWWQFRNFRYDERMCIISLAKLYCLQNVHLLMILAGIGYFIHPSQFDEALPPVIVASGYTHLICNIPIQVLLFEVSSYYCLITQFYMDILFIGMLPAVIKIWNKVNIWKGKNGWLEIHLGIYYRIIIASNLSRRHHVI